MKTNFRIVMALFFLGACCLLFYLSKEDPIDSGCQGSPIPVCGTNSALDSIRQKGKMIFNSNCAACHKMHVRAIGPAMAETVNEYKSRQLNLHGYIVGKRDEMINEVRKTDTIHCAEFPQLTFRDASAIEKYAESFKP